MPQLSQSAATSLRNSKAERAALARLSPIGGIESTILTTVTLTAVGASACAGSLLPIIGGFGSTLMLVGLSLIIERLSRPLVLWVLGQHVYMTLLRMGGTQVANQVAHLYASGNSLSADQLDQLIKRNEQRIDLAAKGLSR